MTSEFKRVWIESKKEESLILKNVILKIKLSESENC